MTHEDPDRQEFLREAARYYDEMIGKAGPGSGQTFDDIERQAEKAGRALILKLLHSRLQAEEKAQCVEVRCPKCGHLMRRTQAWPRNLETASGMVHYQRRHAICDRCGASFSPSGP